MAIWKRGQDRGRYRSGTTSREVGPRDWVPRPYAEKTPPPITAKFTAYGVAFVASVLLAVVYPYLNPPEPQRSERPDDYPETTIQCSFREGTNTSSILVEDYNFIGAKREDLGPHWVWYSGKIGTNNFKGRGFLPTNFVQNAEFIINKISDNLYSPCSTNTNTEIKLIKGKESISFSPHNLTSDEKLCELSDLIDGVRQTIRGISQ